MLTTIKNLIEDTYTATAMEVSGWAAYMIGLAIVTATRNAAVTAGWAPELRASVLRTTSRMGITD